VPKDAQRTLRILMVAPTSFFADYGCHVRILEETRALQRLGHEVLICTYHNGNDVEGIPIRRSIDIPWRKRVVVGSSRHKLYLDAVLSFEVLRAVRTFQPDIIHAHLHEGALIGGIAGILTRRPVVFDYQGSLTEEMFDHGFLRNGSRLAGLMRKVERFIDRLPGLIVTSSENARCRLVQRGYPEDCIRTVLDAVDTERFSQQNVPCVVRSALRKQLGIGEGRRVIGYLGLLAPYQGTDLLLDAAQMVIERCPDTHFLMMGFPGNEAYQAQAARRGIGEYTSFPGRIPYAEAHQYLALVDLAVAPKMSLTEGNGKLYNYMAMGLPVVTFDAAANREILGDADVYVPHGSAEGLAERIIWMLENPRQACRIGAQLRERAESLLSWNTRVIELVDVYSELLSARR
jgi:glycosyltransferase involved in cell wall biosynthesis